MVWGITTTTEGRSGDKGTQGVGQNRHRHGAREGSIGANGVKETGERGQEIRDRVEDRVGGPIVGAGSKKDWSVVGQEMGDMQAGSKKDGTESDRGKERMGVTLMNKLGGPGVGAGGRKAGQW